MEFLSEKEAFGHIINSNYMYKSLIIRSIITSIISFIVVVLALAIPHTIHADLNNLKPEAKQPTLVHNGHLTLCKLNKENYHVVKTIKTIVTAYSSTPDQTDDTPFITASGKHVANGVIAYNKLPFGTKVRIPELYGNKIFTVWDRMHQRMKHFDIWFADTQEAKNFGAKITTIEVVES